MMLSNKMSQIIFSKFLLMGIFLIMTSVSFAQENANSLDEMYVPTENSVFNKEGGVGDREEVSGKEYKHLISFNPLLLTRGVAAVHYQYFLKESIAFYAGIGNSFGLDYIMAVGSIADMSEFFDTEDVDVGLADLLVEGEFVSGANLFFNAGTNFYYDSFWGSDYSFFGLDYRHSNVNLEYQTNINTSTGGSSVKNFDISTRSNSVNFLFGFENSSDGAVAMFHRFYWGFGIRQTSFEEIAYTSQTDFFGNTTTPEYNLTGDRAKQYSLSLHLGYAFGIGW